MSRPLSYPRPAPGPWKGSGTLIGKCWIWSRLSLSSCDILDNSAKSYLPPEKKQDSVFLPVSIYNSLPEGGRGTEGELPMVRALPPTAISTGRPQGLCQATPRAEMSCSPRNRAGLGTSATTADLLQVTSSAQNILFQWNLPLLLQFTHCTNQHNLSSGGKGADFSLGFCFVLFLAQATAQPVTWSKRGKSQENVAKLQVGK